MEETICRYCRAPIDASEFFCPNCGKKLKDKPLSTSVLKQIFVYLVSALFPPFGLWWAVKYIRQKDGTSKSRNIGVAVIAITVVSLALNLWGAIALYDTYLGILDSYSSLNF